MQRKKLRRNSLLALTLILLLGSLFLKRVGLVPLPAAAYSSFAQLVAEQQEQGYLPAGRFGDSWPAQLIETITGEGEVEFVRRDGTPHRYTKFDGYRLKVLRLGSDAGGEVILVLRSRERVGSMDLAVPAPGEDAWEREVRLIREERIRADAR